MRTIFTHPQQRTFAGSILLNNIGEIALTSVLSLIVWKYTHSTADMQLVTLTYPIAIILGPKLGTLMDRFGPRAFYTASLVMQTVSILGLMIILTFVPHQFWLIFVAALTNQIGSTMFLMTWTVGIRFVFPTTAGTLRGYLNTLYQFAKTIGPLISAAVLLVTGYQAILLINLICFLIPLLIQLRNTNQAQITNPQHVHASSTRPKTTMRTGLRYLLHNPQLRYLTISYSVFNLFLETGFITYIMTILKTHRHLTDAAITLIIASKGISLLLGSLLANIANGRYQWRMFSISIMIVLIGLGVFCFGQTGTIAGLLILSVGMGIRKTLGVSLLFTASTRDNTGTVDGVFNLITGPIMLLSPLLYIQWTHTMTTAQIIILLLLITLGLLAHTLWFAWTENKQHPHTPEHPATPDTEPSQPAHATPIP